MIEIYNADLSKEKVTKWLDTLIVVRKEYENIARMYESDGIYDIGGWLSHRIHVRGIKEIASLLDIPVTDNPNWDEEHVMGEWKMPYGEYELFELYSLEEEKE